jgi:sugar phosphate isomerase/epimerase
VRLAFSNLAAPGWSLERCCDAVREYGYDGLELRLYDGEPIDVLAPPDLSAIDVPVCCLDTSIQLAGDFERELPAAIELARVVGAPAVRVFGGEVASLDGVARRLLPLLVEDVVVALETHDAFSSAARVAELLRLLDAPGFAALWDVCHTWRAGESPTEARELLADRVALLHVKDARRNGELTLLGEGDVPWAESVAGYEGWVSVEWEKRWHPELAAPEIALPQHVMLLR